MLFLRQRTEADEEQQEHRDSQTRTHSSRCLRSSKRLTGSAPVEKPALAGTWKNPEKRTIILEGTLEGTPGNRENPKTLAYFFIIDRLRMRWRVTAELTSEQTAPQFFSGVFSFAATRWVCGNDSSCSLRDRQGGATRPVTSNDCHLLTKLNLHPDLSFFTFSATCPVPPGNWYSLLWGSIWVRTHLTLVWKNQNGRRDRSVPRLHCNISSFLVLNA